MNNIQEAQNNIPTQPSTEAADPDIATSLFRWTYITGRVGRERPMVIRQPFPRARREYSRDESTIGAPWTGWSDWEKNVRAATIDELAIVVGEFLPLHVVPGLSEKRPRIREEVHTIPDTHIVVRKMNAISSLFTLVSGPPEQRIYHQFSIYKDSRTLHTNIEEARHRIVYYDEWEPHDYPKAHGRAMSSSRAMGLFCDNYLQEKLLRQAVSGL